MTGVGNKAFEVLKSDHERHGIDIGMKRNPLGPSELGVKEDSDVMGWIIQQSERRNRTWRNPEMGHQSFW